MTDTEPTTKPKRAARQSVFDKAVVGDLVIAYAVNSNGKVTGVVAIEQVLDSTTAPEIIERWKDQGITSRTPAAEVWEARPGGYYRRRGTR